jgi:DNA invertase Pin-like site-specific DNA recombinase
MDIAPNARVYTITRASTDHQEESPDVQNHQLGAYCEKEGLRNLIQLDEPLATSGTIPFRHRPMGRKILTEARRGDVVVCTDVDRLGRNAADIMQTCERLKAKGVKLIILQLCGMDIDVSTEMGYLVLIIFAWGAQYEHRRIRERTQRAIRRKMELGLLCVHAGYGKRKVVVEGHGAHWEWDHAQLNIIAEIAERLGKGQDVAKVAADIWRRGVKDHRGLPWGQVQHKGTGKGQGQPYEHFRKATRWFHRQKHAGKLPPPYGALAQLIPESPTFTIEKRPKKVTPKPKIDPRANWTAEEWAKWAAIECPDHSLDCS